MRKHSVSQINGQLDTADVIWIYNNPPGDFLGKQKSFDHVSEEDYKQILAYVIDEMADDLDLQNLGYDYIGVGADISPEIDDRLVNDIVSNTILAHLSPVEDFESDEKMRLFKVS
jgi:hypothetical protein